ncbi:predicted protein [Nematostella vectensis]|uniref:U3 small nucleolar RNA-associated protein 11 n=1 Tax=Nematostella vectensis TaxID=45351 RepID=A7SRW1_NEMVE|nr:probable U3 small nucleolar RNA-associated protein 11 [Nematostella vectensis]XP_032228991.1 probable U3 small nucleolar RNA-associated protein 11 [Nematostella vectensis]EDO33548.1 predicted protein [Nematostella vectensis]|eukprot:XP_001625648.1 predicted protein [Nematostella vectensis]
MSAFAKAKKSYQKNHKERGQLKNRHHLGLLEKHKDYVLRARDYHKKKEKLKNLREKALNKNPDEFYFKMISTKTKDGVHHVKQGKQHTADQLKLMKAQDLNYVNSKKTAEAKKIERLQASLHLLESSDGGPPNQHIVFVDNKKEAKAFDPATHFGTLPELMNRTYNRPSIDTLKTSQVTAPVDEQSLKKIERQRNRQYEELKQRIERKEKMQTLTEKLQLEKHLMGKGPRVKVKDATDDQPAVYRWKKKRRK